jgi:prepilin-type N-terminal cleavage/methylation domain-containing protein
MHDHIMNSGMQPNAYIVDRSMGEKRMNPKANWRTQEAGFTFVEVLISLVILSIIATGFLSALAASSRSALRSEEHTSAESLARTEMEYVKNSIYVMASWTYTMPIGSPPWDATHTLPAGYNGYAVKVSAAPIRLVDDGIQSITIVVSRGGRAIFTLEDFKVGES